MGRIIQKVIPKSIRLAWLNLMRNRRRSLLSVAIVTIAVAALTVSGGFGLYTYDSLQESTARDIGHMIISQPGYFEQEEEAPLKNGLAHYQQLQRKLIINDEVRAVQPRINFSGLVSNGDKTNIYIGIGVDYREFDVKGPFLNIQEGKTLSSQPDPAEPEVMLATDLANNLRVNVGDWVTLLSSTSEGALNAIDYKVRGIFSTGVPELDKRQLYIHLTDAQLLLDSNKVSSLSVYLYETGLTQSLLGMVEQMAGELQVTPWWEQAFYYENVKNLYDRIFGMMGAIMALVVFVSLFNTMTMSVTERTREIGTLSALGAYPAEVIAGFVRESGLLAVIGALFGSLLSLAISLFTFVADIQMPPPPGGNEGYPLHVYFSLELALWAGAGVMMICILAAFFAARKGVNKPITEALIHV